MRDPDIFLFMLLIMLPIAILCEVWHLYSTCAGLKSWARKNGLAILCSQKRTFFMGPFYWTTSRFETVWRVTVRDKAGRVRDGWVRCGTWPWAFLSSLVEVRWDEVATSHKKPRKGRLLDG